MTRRISTALACTGVLLVAGPCLAAHFVETGTPQASYANTLTLTLISTCNFDWDTGAESLTIAPDPGESPGDEVLLTWCVSAVATAGVTGPAYSAVGGIGGPAFTVNCLPSPGWTNPDPAIFLLNPGPGQTEFFSYGPEEIFGGDPPLTYDECGSTVAHIGDEIGVNGGVFALVTGPAADPGTFVTLTYSADIELVGRAIPSLSRPGAAVLALLVALAAVAILRAFRS